MKHTGNCFCGAIELQVSGRAGGHGVLPLPLMPFLVRRSGECVQPLEAPGGGGHQGRRAYRDIRDDAR